MAFANHRGPSWIWLRFLVILLGLTGALGARARADAAAPAPGSPPSPADPLRIIVPQVYGGDEESRLCVALFLEQRLGQCPSVRLLEGERARQWVQWLTGGSWSLSGAQRWQEVQRHVSLDASIELYQQPAGAGPDQPESLHMSLLDSQGRRNCSWPTTTPLPELARLAGEQLGQWLNLPAAERQALAKLDIRHPGAFAIYYKSQRAWAPWPQNPFATTLNSLADRTLPEDPAVNAARLRAGIGYVNAGRRIVEPPKLQISEGYVKKSCLQLLGTTQESALTALRGLSVAGGLGASVEQLFLQVVKPLSQGPKQGAAAETDTLRELDELAKPNEAPEAQLSAVADPTMVSVHGGRASFTQAEQLSALQALAYLRSQRALPILALIASSTEPAVRQAVALTLAQYPRERGAPVLGKLAQDADADVAFAAGYGLWKRGELAAADAVILREKAGKRLGASDPLRRQAGQILMDPQAQTPLDLLTSLAGDADAQLREEARRLLEKRPAENDARRLEQMLSPDPQAVLAALQRLTAPPPAALQPALRLLCDDHSTAVAWAARDLLAPLCPSDPQGKMAFDLAIADPLLRRMLVDQLARSKEPWADKVLRDACGNTDARTRIKALAAALQRDAAAAHDLLIQALADPHRRVQLHADALAVTHAQASNGPALATALEKQRGLAHQIYLRQALAKANGQPAPPPPPAARSVADRPNLTWLCPGGDADSLYQAYYQMTLKVDEQWKRAYQAGKIYFVRVEPVGNPGTIAVDNLVADNTALVVAGMIPNDDLPYIDGVVYGEESMSMAIQVLWEKGWQPFCGQAGIDRAAIAGDFEKLDGVQKQAWHGWAMERQIDGFNELYEQTHLELGARRPGLQVCTFLPVQMLHEVGPNPADQRWKFDVGGVYHYIGDTRLTAYSMVRRHKTLWPERPVIWLSNGIGVYERTPIQYQHGTPGGPMVERSIRAYNDSVAAHLAGAQTGWFSIWAFLPYDWVNTGMASLKGPTVTLEELYPGSPKLKSAIAFSFAGVAELYRNKAGASQAAKADLSLETGDGDAGAERLLKEGLDEPKSDPFEDRVSKEKQRMFQGFLFYRQYLDHLAALFTSLPRPAAPQALVIEPGVELWSGTVGSPCSDLLPLYDFLLDFNKVQGMDLNRYRLIAARRIGALTNGAIDKVNQWLTEQPGILYVNQHLSTSPGAELCTVEDMDRKLESQWLWAQEVQMQLDPKPPAAGQLILTGGAAAAGASLTIPAAHMMGQLQLTGASAQVLYAVEGKPALVLWRKPGLRGAVLFDMIEGGGWPYRQALQQQLKRLFDAEKLGLDTAQMYRVEMLDGPACLVATSAGGGPALTFQGADLISGTIDPSLVQSSVVIGREFIGPYAAAHANVAVLSNAPLQQVANLANGLSLQTKGLLQVVTAQPQKLQVQTAAGRKLPEIEAAALNEWVLTGTGEGIATYRVALGGGKKGSPAGEACLTYVRCGEPVKVTLEP